MPSQSTVPSIRKAAPDSGISTAHRVAHPAARLTSRSLTASYLTALGLIALWTALGQVVMQSIIVRQFSDAQVISLAERQTMLSQRLSEAALILQTQPEPKERDARVHAMIDAASTLAHGEAALQHGDAHLGLTSPASPQTAQALASAAPSLTAMLAAAHQIQHFYAKGHVPSLSQLAPVCRQLLAAERGYVADLDPVMTSAQAEAREHGSSLRWTGLLIGVGLLGILVLEGLFLFAPMMKRIQAQLGQTKNLDVRLAEQAAHLKAQQAELNAHQEATAALEASLAEATRHLDDADVRIHQADSRFHELFHRLPVACYSFDSYGRVVEWNRACETLYQRPATEAAQQPLWEIMTPPHEWDVFREVLTGVLQGTSSEREWDQVLPSGSRLPILSTMFPVHGPNGRIAGGISANIDVSARRQHEAQIQEHAATLTQQREALEQANARLHTLAMEDGVTGLKNHRAFHEALTREFARVIDSGCRDSLSVVMMDVDAFKQYNENFGHAAGDDVLRRIAQILLRSARGGDLVARYGGEEFAVMLSQTDRRGAAAYAERVRASIAAAPWSFQAVTASLGVTTLRVDTPAAAVLIAEADAALNRAKSAGRNRVTFSDDPPAVDATASESRTIETHAVAPVAA